MNWPNFFIVGTSKAGTTSLYNYLNAINEIYLAPKGKIHYFFPEEFEREKSKQEYLSLFRNIKKEKVIGEYAGYLNNEESPQLIKKTLPDSKIIISIRNPIDRAFSHYLGALRGYDEVLSFDESFDKYMKPINEKTDFFRRYIEAGLYYEKVKRFINIFGIDKVKIIVFEEFIEDPKKVFRDTLDFLELDSQIPPIVGEIYNAYAKPLGKFGTSVVSNQIINNITKKIFSKNTRVFLLRLFTNKRGEKPKLANSYQEFLKEFYYDDSKKLEELLQKELPWNFLRE